MQAITRRLGQQSLRPIAASISYLNSISDHSKKVYITRNDLTEAIAMPREALLEKVSFPLPNPGIFNLDQIHAFATDTVLSEDALTFMDLGLVPPKLKGYPVEFLIQYRKGGPQFGSTVSKKVNPEN